MGGGGGGGGEGGEGKCTYINKCFKWHFYVTHKAVRPGARPHVPPVMAEGDFRLMTPQYDNLQ